MVERTGATFPIGYGLKVPEVADRVGAYWEERRGIIHATNFTLGPDKKILPACAPSDRSAELPQSML